MFHAAILIKCLLVGTFKVSGVFPLSAGQAYCKPNGILENKKECSCSSSAENLAKMDALSDGKCMGIVFDYCLLIKRKYVAYNQQLQTIANKYKGQPNGTFAVMYSPAPIDISSFPIDALRFVDNTAEFSL